MPVKQTASPVFALVISPVQESKMHFDGIKTE